MNKKIRLAIIGTGCRGTWTFGEILKDKEDVEIAALCDVNPVRLQAAAKTLKINPALYTFVDEMASKENFDGVIITTPDSTHYEISMKALQNNWNVLVDKPLATNVADCKKLIAVAEEKKLTLMIGFNLRHHAVLKRLKELIDNGDLGRVFLAENREFYDGGKTYMSRWNRLFANTGGLWIHKGSHDFDVFNWLLDFPKIERVCSFAAINVLTPQNLPFEKENGIEPGPGCDDCYYQKKCPDRFLFSAMEADFWSKDAIKEDGYCRNQCMYLSDKDVHDNGIAMVEYANGIKVSHMECFIGCKNDRVYTVVGDKAIAEVSLSDRTIKVTCRWSGETVTYSIPAVSGGHGGADPSLVDTFCKVIRGEAQPNSTAIHGLWASAIGQAAEISRREHRMVDMSELLGE
ncbi:MAG: Gfo/Idh/MocA family oxidoreductase [Lentisphaeria bacterium]|nr:Gfo/Idh/MocA family oxidoreductase [Lentisphaeria bacterium]